MGLISFFSFGVKLPLVLKLATWSKTSHSRFPLIDIDHMEIENCSNLSAAFKNMLFLKVAENENVIFHWGPLFIYQNFLTCIYD